MSSGSNLIRSVFSNWSVFLFNALANFFLSPYVVHHLGKEAYGTWALLVALVGYLGILDLGVRGAVTRYIARMRAMGDHAASTRYASAGLFVFSLTSVAALVLGGVIAAALDKLFTIPAELLTAARFAVVLSSATIATTFISGVYGGIVTGLQRFDVNAVVEIGVEMFRVAALVTALRIGWGLAGIAAIQLVCGLLRLGIAVRLSRRLYPEATPSLRGWSLADMKAIVGFSATTTALRSAGLILTELDAVVIGMFLPVAEIAYFAVGGNLVEYARAAVQTISYTMLPRISALEGVGATTELRGLTLLTARIGTLVLLPIVITYFLRGGTFIGLWMGSDFVTQSGRVLTVLSLPLCFAASRSIMTSALIGLDRHRALILPQVLEAATNLGLSVWLVRRYGIVGVAWGTAIPALLTSAIVLPIIWSRVLEVPIRRMVLGLWVRPAIAMTPFALATAAAEAFLPASSLLGFVLEVVLVLPFAAAGAWYLGLTREERALFGARLKRTRWLPASQPA